MMMQLKQYQWKNRLLLIFAPSPEDEQYQEQLELLNNENELLERDLVLFHILGSHSGFAGEILLSEEEVTQLQKKFTVGPGAFTLVLIGKDSTEKQRWDKPIKSGDLFALIDDMPMRQREMR
jgi:Domain of unknown function (DUF4174)